MSLAKYSQYKPSGADWIGDVPIHWMIKPLKRSLSLITNKAESASNPVGLENIESWSGKWVDSATEFQGQGIEFSVGDVLFGKLRPYLAKALLAESTGEAIGDFHVLRPAQDVEAKFALYCVLHHGFISTVSGAAYGSKMPRVGWEFLSTLPFPVPAPHEQRAIASFLDHETAKIDALVEEQKRLIKLLKEKRQTVISQAVTKGLDPNVPIKDSGVEWLGEVPAHWATPTLALKADGIGDGLHSTPSYQDGTGYYFINGNNLINGRIVPAPGTKEVPQEEYRKHFLTLDRNTVLLSINGTVGNTAVYHGESVILGKSAAYIKCGKQLNAEFFAHYLRCSQVRHYFDLEVTGTTISNLSLSSIRKMRVCLPPILEQTEIVNVLRHQTNRYDNYISEAESLKKLLSERRSALISAAVTGKIDVRNWQAPQPTATECQPTERKAAS